MKDPSIPSKKNLGQWLGYSSMATALLAVAPKADAQVIYTDLDPDAVLYDVQILSIDFDGDGFWDLRVKHDQYSHPSFTYDGTATKAHVKIHDGSVIGYYQAFQTLASILPSGAPISPDATNFQEPAHPWNEQVLASHVWSYYASEFFSHGNWFGVTGYVGFRFRAGDNELHYGWIQLAVSEAADTVTVMDYAYEFRPNMGINAGDMDITTGVASNKANPFHVGLSPNPANDLVSLHFRNTGSGKMQLNVLDAMGKVYRTEKLGDADAFTLNVADLASGVYFVRLKDERTVAYRKFIKE